MRRVLLKGANGEGCFQEADCHGDLCSKKQKDSYLQYMYERLSAMFMDRWLRACRWRQSKSRGLGKILDDFKVDEGNVQLSECRNCSVLDLCFGKLARPCPDTYIPGNTALALIFTLILKYSPRFQFHDDRFVQIFSLTLCYKDKRAARYS